MPKNKNVDIIRNEKGRNKLEDPTLMHHFILEKKGDVKAIKNVLMNLPSKEKGYVFETFISVLYEKNGYKTGVEAGKNDGGADVLVFVPEKPDRIFKIIQVKNHVTPLNYDDTRTELRKFEENASTRYDCHEFEIICTSGFVKNAMALQRYNMNLRSWEYIAELLATYGKDNGSPTLQLNAHNQDTFDKASKLLKTNQRVSIVQATGTGKRYLVGKALLERADDDVLFLSPSNHINEQQRGLLPFLNKVTYQTYPGLLSQVRSHDIVDKYDFIVLDEFHRIGNAEWRKAFDKLMNCHKKTKVLGVTATPVRFLDDNRDMRTEIFNDICANELSLEEAIVRKILLAPKYISGLFDIDAIKSDMLDKIAKNKILNYLEKEKLIGQAESMCLDWSKTSGVPELLDKHLPSMNGKYMIFCESEEQLINVVDDACKWFRQAAKKKGDKYVRVEHYIAHSNLNPYDLKSDLEKFKSATTDKGIHLMFSINMFNEGLHLDGVNCVMMLRKTQSPIVYLQQMGRCLSSGSSIQPVIFDLVDNAENTGSHSFKKRLDNALAKENKARTKDGLRKVVVDSQIIDELRNVRDVLRSLAARLGGWNIGLSALKQYIRKKGDALVPKDYKTDDGLPLGGWVSSRRSDFNQNRLGATKVVELDELGFIWDIEAYYWQEFIGHLKNYITQMGNVLVPKDYKTDDGFPLGMRVSSRRTDFNQNRLGATKVVELNELGFIWDIEAYFWQELISHLQNYLTKMGNALVPAKYNTDDGLPLGQWVSQRRSDFKENRLGATQVAELNELGFIWDVEAYSWREFIDHLKNYIAQMGNALVPANYKTDDDFALGSRVIRRRSEFNKNKLEAAKVADLNDLGFIWDVEAYSWQEFIAHLKTYIAKQGDTLVPQLNKTDDGFPLGQWAGKCRSDFKKNRLGVTKVAELNELGFIWDVEAYSWQEFISHLKNYLTKMGNALVPAKYKTDDGFKLGSRVNVCRTNFKTNRLGSTKVAELNELDFIWDVEAYFWQEFIFHLKNYISKMGNALVPASYKTDDGFKLGSKVSERRQEFKKNRLKTAMVVELNELGFIWDFEAYSWQTFIDNLKNYIAKMGNTLVPKDYKTDDGFPLGMRVSRRRKEFKENGLGTTKVAELNELGFIWDTEEYSWQEFIGHLKNYIAEMGNALVPANYKTDDGFRLGTRVVSRRYDFNNNCLDADKVAVLNKLGFIWSVR